LAAVGRLYEHMATTSGAESYLRISVPTAANASWLNCPVNAARWDRFSFLQYS
jgi:hypothetical protein